MNERRPFLSGEALISWSMGGANICTLWVWLYWRYHISIPSLCWSLSRSKRRTSCLLRRLPCPALHWTCYHGVLDYVNSFKWLTNQVGCIIVKARVARQRKQTLSLGCALGLGSFTAINPWLHALTITKPQELLLPACGFQWGTRLTQTPAYHNFSWTPMR